MKRFIGGLVLVIALIESHASLAAIIAYHVLKGTNCLVTQPGTILLGCAVRWRANRAWRLRYHRRAVAGCEPRDGRSFLRYDSAPLRPLLALSIVLAVAAHHARGVLS